MRGSGRILFVLAMLVGTAAGQSILVYDQNTQNQAGQAAAMRASMMVNVVGSATFATEVMTGTYDLVLVDLPSNEPTGSWQMALETYIAAGGRVIHSQWNAGSFTPTLAAALEVTSAGSHQTQDLYEWNGHPIFSSPNMVDPLFDVWQDLWGTNGFFLEPTGTAVAAAGFTMTPTPNQAGIVIGNSNRTIMNGFLFDDYNTADKDADMIRDIVELIENEIRYILGPSCTITAPMAMGQVTGDVALTFDVNDPEMDPLIATFEFTTDGGMTYLPCTPAASSPRMNPSMPIATPSTGESFVWDSVADQVAFLTTQMTGIRITVIDAMTMGSCDVQVEVDNVVPLPVCTLTTPGGTSMGDITFDLTLQSINMPFVDFTAEFSTDNGVSWNLATASAASPTTNPATGLLVGAHQFVWDSRTDGVALMGLVPGVLFQLLADDGVAPIPGICASMPFDIDNTSLCGSICGDCNEDTQGPNIIDGLTAAQIAAGLITPTMSQTGCCDVNASMSIDVLDALVIAQAAAGLPATLTCP